MSQPNCANKASCFGSERQNNSQEPSMEGAGYKAICVTGTAPSPRLARVDSSLRPTESTVPAKSWASSELRSSQGSISTKAFGGTRTALSPLLLTRVGCWRSFRAWGSTLRAKSWDSTQSALVFWQLVDLGSASLPRVWALDETLTVTRQVRCFGVQILQQ